VMPSRPHLGRGPTGDASRIDQLVCVKIAVTPLVTLIASRFCAAVGALSNEESVS